MSESSRIGGFEYLLNVSLRGILTFSVLFLTVAGIASAQGEFFIYPSGCQVNADGSLTVEASAQTAGASGSSTDGDSFVATFPIPSSTDLTFTDSGTAGANLALPFNDGCSSRAESSVGGTTSYDFDGDLSTMVFTATSERSHKDSVIRSPFGASGSPATAASDYVVDQLDSINVVVPFLVGGGDNGVLTIEEFSFSRTDSGPTTGSMVAAWQVFEDTNGNCKLDSGEQALGGDAGIVFPNDTYSGPMLSFPIPRNNYILWLTYFTRSEEDVTSPDCSQDAAASSRVTDGVVVRMRLN